MQERHEQMTEELRKQERARDLLRELERRLKGQEHPELEEHLAQLERLSESLPEAHMARLVIESAVGSVRTRDARKSGSDVSRARSVMEGRVSTLRGSLNYGSSGT